MNKSKIHKLAFVVVVTLFIANYFVPDVFASEKLINEYVVVVDPGHDNTHGGAHKNGLKEEVINLEIANYCKAYLESYGNITVYLTQDDLICPFPGTDAKECNRKRCDFAASVEADLFISIHVNSSDSKYRRGFEVIYPNVNYKPELNEQGEILATLVAEELKKTGLRFREIYTRDSTENKKIDENFNPDGTRADYYNVIRNSKYHDILGIIIEHGYISNWNDAKGFLSTDDSLKELGESDAKAIIEYLLFMEEDEVIEIEKELLQTEDEEILEKEKEEEVSKLLIPLMKILNIKDYEEVTENSLWKVNENETSDTGLFWKSILNNQEK